MYDDEFYAICREVDAFFGDSIEDDGSFADVVEAVAVLRGVAVPT